MRVGRRDGARRRDVAFGVVVAADAVDWADAPAEPRSARAASLAAAAALRPSAVGRARCVCAFGSGRGAEGRWRVGLAARVGRRDGRPAGRPVGRRNDLTEPNRGTRCLLAMEVGAVSAWLSTVSRL